MATKFKMISDEDVKVIRAARKALTRIAKKLLVRYVKWLAKLESH